MIQLLHLFAELPQAERFILVLAALLPGGNDDARRQVPEADGRFRLVDVLASGAARTEGIDLAFSQQVFIRLRQFNHVYLRIEMPIRPRYGCFRCRFTMSGIRYRSSSVMRQRRFMN